MNSSENAGYTPLGSVPFLFVEDAPLGSRQTLRRQGMTGQTVRRGGKTLYKPERYVEPAPLFTDSLSRKKKKNSPWRIFSRTVTCCISGCCLRSCGVKGTGPMQAWREKVALCWVAFLLSALVVFFIVGFGLVFCPDQKKISLNPIADKLT
ncbi:hypothetical protein HK096_001585, partial [Nowakowskiella sp. JEL0078]